MNKIPNLTFTNALKLKIDPASPGKLFKTI